ncbi:MAG: hypothetical protein J0H29_21030 [Sphingobacteriales bacterium]|nr:hypothetical protein [Sphingobacteriales bacterium]
MKKKTTKAGRKELPAGEVKIRVQVFIKQSIVDNMGGFEAARDKLVKYADTFDKVKK